MAIFLVFTVLLMEFRSFSEPVAIVFGAVLALFGAGADMLKPLAIAVIGALCISALLSLIATPTVFFLMRRRWGITRILSALKLWSVGHARLN